jgi:hypothetical protein
MIVTPVLCFDSRMFPLLEELNQLLHSVEST